ncbi:hypothetical protein PoB_004038800 [Plakobranchus ocellatus]|uniref:Uncharacterized protein n=1 Tax=Plakobranchus ocellatus TaxID=259542 RepID=A0AAV4B2T2_9GAST|nr:hypothetical protein PoB_004038800 [Plakobranchus ocellatus]
MKGRWEYHGDGEVTASEILALLDFCLDSISFLVLVKGACCKNAEVPYGHLKNEDYIQRRVLVCCSGSSSNQQAKSLTLPDNSRSLLSTPSSMCIGRGAGGTVDSESAVRSAETLLSRVRTPPPGPWLVGGPESLRSTCCGLAIYNNQPFVVGFFLRRND